MNESKKIISDSHILVCKTDHLSDFCTGYGRSNENKIEISETLIMKKLSES